MMRTCWGFRSAIPSDRLTDLQEPTVETYLACCQKRQGCRTTVTKEDRDESTTTKLSPKETGKIRLRNDPEKDGRKDAKRGRQYYRKKDKIIVGRKDRKDQTIDRSSSRYLDTAWDGKTGWLRTVEESHDRMTGTKTNPEVDSGRKRNRLSKVAVLTIL